MATYAYWRYLFMTLDPVHVGTGGYRLGRVDNSIVREPGTRVPKIPGTSLHGAARSYAAQLYENPAAAGQDQERVADPDQDPVCYTFGYLKKVAGQEDKTIAYSGVVNVFDAQVLLFPVPSMVGPVWVTTESRLREAEFIVNDLPDEWERDAIYFTGENEDVLNLGWLMLKIGGKISVTAPEKWRVTRWQAVQQRVALVREELFSQIVNSNLEVRTSVSIDPERGAAKDKALFTYEALPRTTFLVADVVLDDYRDGLKNRPFPRSKTLKNHDLPGGSWKGPMDVLTAGLRMIEWLGVGGMGTRGFGRMAIVGEPLERECNKEVHNDECHTI